MGCSCERASRVRGFFLWEVDASCERAGGLKQACSYARTGGA